MSRVGARALIQLYQDAAMAISTGGGAVRDDLQELVDEVSRLLGRPGHAGGRRVHPARVLRPRRQRAPRRWTPSAPARSSPAARRRPPAPGSRSSASPRAEAPLRTPADEAAGILTRLVIPVRHAGRTRGYLWLLDGGRIDPTDDGDRAAAAAVDLAAEAGRLLAERAAADEDLGRPLRDRARPDGAAAAGQAVRTPGRVPRRRRRRRCWSP